MPYASHINRLPRSLHDTQISKTKRLVLNVLALSGKWDNSMEELKIIEPHFEMVKKSFKQNPWTGTTIFEPWPSHVSRIALVPSNAKLFGHMSGLGDRDEGIVQGVPLQEKASTSGLHQHRPSKKPPWNPINN